MTSLNAMSEKQKSIKKNVVLEGRGLHTGNMVRVRLKPAPAGNGIRFIRTDLPGSPVIEANPQNIIIDSKVPRCTSLGKEGHIIHTVEHFMSALFGARVDNIDIEINGNELPGLDGSGIEYLKAIKKAGVVDLEAPQEPIVITEPMGVTNNGSSIFVVPDSEFKVSYTLDYRHPFLQTQFFSSRMDGDIFEREIAPCRTFCLEEEAEELKSRGLGQGADYANTLVVGRSGVINNTPRFPDEFARHKILDFIGDLYLLGRPLRGQVFAVKSGHYLNVELLKKIYGQMKLRSEKGFVPQYDLGDHSSLDIARVMKILPHRYPFLFVDRIVQLEKGQKAVGIKNVTINDQFFTGHFPTRPIMPGVLMVEALAQTGGVLVLTSGMHEGKVALFMATDKVRFRKLVEPGDQLRLEVTILRDRPRTALLSGRALVNGEVAVEAELLFSFVDASFLERT